MNDPADPLMAEPGKRPTDVGGLPGAPQAGVDRPASDDRAPPPRSAQRGSGIGVTDADANRDDEDDGDEWRHEPIAPVDEPNPLRSLGKAVGETVTGSSQGTATPRKR